MKFKFVTRKRPGRVDSVLIAATAVAASFSSAWGQATSLPSFNPANVYDITVANGSINGGTPAGTGSSAAANTTAIQAYINFVSALPASGMIPAGGTVVIPNGTFDSNALTMKSNVNLQLASGAVLFDSLTATTPSNTFITATSTTNMEISGSGIINGAATTVVGSDKLVFLSKVTKLEVTGVTIENAPQEHLAPENCSNVTINNITIADPGTIAANGGNYLGNTDGIDFSGSNFTIENSSIQDGDDDIVAKAADACSNILITNDAIGAGHGISVGGGSAGGLKNMTVSNITFTGTTNGLRLKAQDATGGDAGGGTVAPTANVLYSNIVMTNVANPLIIDSFYNGQNNYPTSSTQTNKAVDTTTPMWENIGFNNIDIIGSSAGAVFYDLNTTPGNLEGMSFNNVSLNTSSSSTMWWGNNINLSGLTANKSINEADLTNLTPSGPVSITWNNAGSTPAGLSLGNGTTWDTVVNQNWNTGTSFTTYTDSSNVTFNDANNSHYSVTLATTVSPLSTAINNSSGSYTISGAGTIAGTGSLTKTGTGTATLSTSNAFTGGTIISGGTLAITSPNALGASQTLGTATGAKPGATTVNANGSLDLGGQSLTEPITLNGGTLTNSNAATASVNGGVKGLGYTTTSAGIAAGSTITFNSGTAAATPVFGITAANFSGFTGTYAASGSNSTATVAAPMVVITPSDGNGSGALAIAVLTGTSLTGINVIYPGSGYDAAPIITFSGGNGSGGGAVSNAINFTLVGIQMNSAGSGYTSTPTATLHNNGGTGAVTLTPVIGSVTLASTSGIGGNAGNISLGLPITGPGGLNKIGTDSLILSGANIYGGITTVSTGTLLANAANTLSPNSSINVTTGKLDASGSAQVIPSLIVGVSGTLNLGIGNLLADSGAASFGGTLNVAGSPTGSSVELMSYTSDSGTFSSVPTFAGYNLVYGANELDLVAIVTGPASLTWTNASNNNLWDNTGSSNWNNGATTTVFHPQDNVTFDDNNPSNTPANYAVTLNSLVSPGSVTVNNSQGDYTISGSGTIGGTGSLTKSGSGMLTLSTANNYTGGTSVTNGRLLIAQAGSNATFDGGGNLATANTLTALPTGALTVSGNGIVQLADGVTNQTFVTPGGASSVVTSNINLTSLSLTGNGTLDIGNNRIIIDYTTGNDPIASIAQWIFNGFANGEGASAGTGPAIISSDIASDDLASGFSYGIGYADGADGVIAGLPSGEIEIMFTLLGDANLDGQVNSEDFTPFSTNVGQNGAWDNGDFNYDGTVNSEDFTPLSHDLNQPAVLAASETGILLSPLASNGLMNVPEPASTGLLAAGLVSVLARRRRKAKA